MIMDRTTRSNYKHWSKKTHDLNRGMNCDQMLNRSYVHFNDEGIQTLNDKMFLINYTLSSVPGGGRRAYRKHLRASGEYHPRGRYGKALDGHCTGGHAGPCASFISVEPNTSPNSVVKAFKGRSSGFLREEFSELLRLPSLWTRSYFLSTAGNVASETIQKYIENQTRK